jgi:hypothetical protein
MNATDMAERRPLWLLIEEKISEMTSDDLTPDNLENTVRRAAVELDSRGYKVSSQAGHMLQLRWAVADRVEVGRPLMNDLNNAVAALKLEDVGDPYKAAVNIIRGVGEVWPKLRQSERRPDVLRMVENARLDLLITRAKELSGEQGIRLLIEEEVDPSVIVEGLGISEEEHRRVHAAVEAERAERTRVEKLIEAAKGKSDEDKVRDLINNEVSDELIIELGGVDKSLLDSVRQSMEEELKEKHRLAEEEAARKKAEAEGPPLEEIPPDQMLEYIESVREILEFSDKENEIRTMCEQSSIPKALVEIAVSEPEKLDELEEKAGG